MEAPAASAGTQRSDHGRAGAGARRAVRAAGRRRVGSELGRGTRKELQRRRHGRACRGSGAMENRELDQASTEGEENNQGAAQDEDWSKGDTRRGTGRSDQRRHRNKGVAGARHQRRKSRAGSREDGMANRAGRHGQQESEQSAAGKHQGTSRHSMEGSSTSRAEGAEGRPALGL